MRKVANTVLIKTKKNTVEIVVDDNKIDDVLSYTLKEDEGIPILILELAVTGAVEAQIG